jgi:hypothetical protein
VVLLSLRVHTKGLTGGGMKGQRRVLGAKEIELSFVATRISSNSPMPPIPNPLIAVAADLLAHVYTHTQIENRFLRAGIDPMHATGSNKVSRCQSGLRFANLQLENPLEILGTLVEETIEVAAAPATYTSGTYHSTTEEHKERFKKQLASHGLSYVNGGHIVPIGSGVTSRTLDEMIRSRDLIGVQHEFERIIGNVEQDPPAAVTAACALLEALFKAHIRDEGLEMPSDQSVLPLWKVIRTSLGLNAGDFEDPNLKKILSGIASMIDGIAGLRTAAGSAHGHHVPASHPSRYRVSARHARLASHGAMTLATFLIETFEARRGRSAS